MKSLFLSICLLFLALSSKAQTCFCGLSGSAPRMSFIEMTLNGKVSKTSCGAQLKLKVKDVLKLKGKYACVGPCKTLYKITFKNLNTGEDVLSSATDIFKWEHTFTKDGYYALIFVPHCANVPRLSVLY
jgi:hypothetical protein